jgi:ABC-2 type transport system permease protein
MALLVLPPLLTMRMLSEEARSGMLEFLLTAPISDQAVVVGKFLAATTFMAIFLASKLGYALTIQLLGTTPDWPAVFGAYIGGVLISAVFCATGLFASALTSTPIVAAFGGLVFNLLLFDLPSRRGLIDSDVWRGLVDSLNLGEYIGTFASGVVDTAALVLFVAWTAMILFLATRAVESRRWR